MPSTYTTPDVYVKETSNLPPSVTAVATAIPAFIGYTEKAGPNDSFRNKAIRISSMLDYEEIFGGAPEMENIEVTFDTNDLITKVTPTPKYYLYHSLKLFYANGGGPCYIYSVGNYETTVSLTELESAFDDLVKEDEPTIMLSPDSSLLDDDHFYSFTNQMIQHCGNMQDRFAIIDAYDGEEDYFAAGTVYLDNFRSRIASTPHIKYAASYYPFLKSSISIPFSYDKITGVSWDDKIVGDNAKTLHEAVKKIYADVGTIASLVDKVETIDDTEYGWKALFDFKATKDIGTSIAERTTVLQNLIKGIKLLSITENHNGDSLKSHFDNIDNIKDLISILGDKFNLGTIPHHIDVNADGISNDDDDELTWNNHNIQNYFSQAMSILNNLYQYAKQRAKALEDLLAQESSFFSYVRSAVQSQGLILPPSGAVAGIYARVDALKGVWNAPANQGISMVNAPVVKISHEEHGRLNVDSNSGKSINAIRSYLGKGILLMGARTLLGNDPEWRYVNVRRLFNYVEESIQESSQRFLFDSNDANTWAKMKGMINNFLYNLWRDGALAGAKPEEAYTIKIGLGESMTAQDILDGYLKAKIGLAAVRPAEFIELEFVQQMQTS